MRNPGKCCDSPGGVGPPGREGRVEVFEIDLWDGLVRAGAVAVGAPGPNLAGLIDLLHAKLSAVHSLSQMALLFVRDPLSVYSVYKVGRHPARKKICPHGKRSPLDIMARLERGTAQKLPPLGDRGVRQRVAQHPLHRSAALGLVDQHLRRCHARAGATQDTRGL
jgi:hypothetical protein